MAMTEATDGDQRHGGDLRHQALEARVRRLEDQVRVLTLALDAASRLRISTPSRITPDIRVAGGKRVRRILEEGHLIIGYPELPGDD
jgi:hypothetical protein